MNHNNNSEQDNRHTPSRRNLIGFAVIILAVIVPLVILSQRQQTLQEASIPDIVSAIEAGEVETLTVQGDFLIATKTDGSSISARKESSISAVESLQLFGISSESLGTLPIVVKNPNGGPGSMLGILLTFAPILLIGFLMFRVMRNMQGGGMMNMGGMGRSNPRVVSGAAEKEQKSELPMVTFDDVAGAEQAKLELLEVVEFLQEIRHITETAYQRAKDILVEQRDKLEALAKELLDVETVERAEFEALMAGDLR